MSENTFNNRIDLTELSNQIQKIRDEIGKVIVGQEAVIDLLITAIIADGHVLIEGVPGVAKTLTAKLLARTIDLRFSRIQFTPDLMPSDIIGTAVFNMKTSSFEFHKGPVFANILLIDEINRAPAKTQAALFEVMEERQVTADGTTYPVDLPFLVVATQNPIEHEGTYRLPEAQLDRFLFKILITYPNLEQETKIIERHNERKTIIDLSDINPVMSGTAIDACRATVHKIHIEPNLVSYIARIVTETRNHPALFLGASPRASVALLHTAKAFAAINGRDFVTPEDIRQMVFPVLRHRVMLTPEKEMEGASPDDVVKQIVESVEIPR